MTPEQRIVLRCVSILCLRWVDDADRDTYLELIRQHRGHLRGSRALEDVAYAAGLFLSAATGLDWARAREIATEALVKLHRADLVAACQQVTLAPLMVAE